MKDTKQIETIDRAKLLYEEKYVEGNYCSEFDGTTKDMIVKVGSPMFKYDAIDPKTRAIHFTNSGMNDSEGTPIFASLSRDGNGGDNIEWFPIAYELKDQKQTDVVGMFQRKIVPLIIRALVFDFSKVKVTGIHTVKEES